MQSLSSSSVVCTSGLTRRHLPPGRIATSAWMWSASLGRKRKKIAKEPLEDCERWKDLMWDRETWVLLCCISQSLEVSLFCHEVLGKRREDRKFHLCGLTSCAKFAAQAGVFVMYAFWPDFGSSQLWQTKAEKKDYSSIDSRLLMTIGQFARQMFPQECPTFLVLVILLAIPASMRERREGSHDNLFLTA